MSKPIERITPPGLPAPGAPYSYAVRAGDFIYVSGQAPIDLDSGLFVLGSIEDETRLVFRNVQRILAACGATLNDVVKCNVYLREAERDFAAMNAVYVEFFGTIRPARTTVGASFGAPGMQIEVDVVAYKPT
ncbi:MAG: RidA family protein [Bryobacterales bacterium]|nr:RidA family protein [Bryobacterales bacterium]